MRRDLDLARRLLQEIEAAGAQCPISALRADLGDTPDDRIRYHLRLLIDAQLIKELDRSVSGSPCVRMTNSGHELLDLSRGDGDWREACRCVEETTGGQSLTAVKAVLVKWAVEAATAYAGSVPPRRRRPVYRVERPRRYLDSYLDREPPVEEPRIDYIRPRGVYRGADRRPVYGAWRERFDWRDAYERDVYYPRYEDNARYEEWTECDRTAEPTVGVSLPVSLV